MAARLIRFRYDGTCVACNQRLERGTQNWWDSETRTARCPSCGNSAAPASTTGRAGGSARAQQQRSRERHRQQTLDAHPHVGRLLLALRDEPQRAKNWGKGAAGEELVGRRLDPLSFDGAIVMHDLRMPRSTANVDHIVVAPSGVWIVDTKNMSGALRRRDTGNWFRRDDRLYVAGRDRTKLALAMTKQVQAVAEAVGHPQPKMHPVLCFVGVEWQLVPQPFDIGSVTVTWPEELVKRIRTANSVPIDVAAVAERIASRLRPAS